MIWSLSPQAISTGWSIERAAIANESGVNNFDITINCSTNFEVFADWLIMSFSCASFNSFGMNGGVFMAIFIKRSKSPGLLTSILRSVVGSFK